MIFEEVVDTRMYSFLTDNNLIYDRQFGFRSKHSTNYALINLTEDIKSYMDRGYIAAGVFTDLQKAFSHQILCDKLTYYGFRGKSLNLIKSFLNNRKQFVSINGFESSKLNITCGVPQGSTLGPLLFLIYLNDLRFCLNKFSSNHFADDTCLIYASKKVKTLETDLNTDLKATSEWLKVNRLSLNIKKSQLIIFHSKSKKVNFTSFSIKLEGSKLKYVKYFIMEYSYQ